MSSHQQLYFIHELCFFYVHLHICTRRPQSLPSPPSCSRSSKKMVARVPKLILLLTYSSYSRLKQAAAAATATCQHPQANNPAKQQLAPRSPQLSQQSSMETRSLFDSTSIQLVIQSKQGGEELCQRCLRTRYVSSSNQLEQQKLCKANSRGAAYSCLCLRGTLLLLYLVSWAVATSPMLEEHLAHHNRSTVNKHISIARCHGQ
jgi:hypothetical protein